MVRAELVAAARSALGGRSRTRPHEMRSERAFNERQPRGGDHRRDETSATPESLTSSFAELLGEHLQLDSRSELTENLPGTMLSSKKTSPNSSPPAAIAGTDRAIMDARLSMERQKFEEREKVLLAEISNSSLDRKTSKALLTFTDLYARALVL